VVSGGAVADKLPRKLQGLSRAAVAGRRNIGLDNAAPRCFGTIPARGGWDLSCPVLVGVG
jgi:hypothetical protein